MRILPTAVRWASARPHRHPIARLQAMFLLFSIRSTPTHRLHPLYRCLHRLSTVSSVSSTSVRQTNLPSPPASAPLDHRLPQAPQRSASCQEPILILQLRPASSAADPKTKTVSVGSSVCRTLHSGSPNKTSDIIQSHFRTSRSNCSIRSRQSCPPSTGFQPQLLVHTSLGATGPFQLSKKKTGNASRLRISAAKAPSIAILSGFTFRILLG